MASETKVAPNGEVHDASHQMTLEERKAKWLDYCDLNLNFYERTRDQQGVLSACSQVLVVVLGALTPILVLWGNPDIPTIVQAAPGAIAAVLTGCMAVLGWNDNYVRFAVTAENLKAERLAFDTNATADYPDQDPQTALRNFAAKVTQLVKAETGDWAKFMLSPKNREAAKSPEKG
jgi:hypothetical protein